MHDRNTSPPHSLRSVPATERDGKLHRRTRLRWYGWLLALLWVSGQPGRADSGLCYSEVQNARAMRERIEREWPLRSSGDALTLYLRQLLGRLAAVSGGATGIPWSVTVARNLAANAFSIGNGNIYVTEGAVGLAETESEMAAVLAHEMGHELAGHFCGGGALEDSGGWFNVFSSGAGDETRRQRVGSLVQELDPAKEIQADRIGVSILRGAGYDPRAMLSVARRLHVDGRSEAAGEGRIGALELLLRGLPPAIQRESPEFRSIRERLAGPHNGR